MEATKPMTIGKAARRAGVGVETIRFYERRGLITRPPKSQSAYRYYPEETISRLRFIKRAKHLGFTLKEIKELLDLRVNPTTTCDVVRGRAQIKIADVEAKIRDLEKIKTALTRLSATCHGAGPASECPILEALDREEVEPWPP
jgi:MerR family mercuric resistance operon transcriptional regulator